MINQKSIYEVGERIAREFQPERIILFGSHAYGNPTTDSDVDLLIILPFEGRPAEKAVEIRLKVRPDFPVDFIVRTPHNVRERLDMGDIFMHEVINKGKIIYEADNSRVGGKVGRRLRHHGTRGAGKKKTKP